MSFIAQPPRAPLLLLPGRARAGLGGETPLVDFRKVLRDLDPDVRAALRAEGHPHRAQLRRARGRRPLRSLEAQALGRDVPDHRPRRRRGEVPRRGLRADLDCRAAACAWSARSRRARDIRGPASRVWHNHTQTFHLSAARGRVPAHRTRLRPTLRTRAAGSSRAALGRAAAAPRGADEQSMHCTYGDGTRDPRRRHGARARRDLEAPGGRAVASAATWSRSTTIAVSHGRLPYQGPRSVAVCLGLVRLDFALASWTSLAFGSLRAPLARAGGVSAVVVRVWEACAGG